MICSHIAKKAWVCKTLTSLHFLVIWTDKKKVKLEGCGCCLCSFFGSRELGWELSWLCPKERMKCILSPLGEMVLPFAFSGAMWRHQFSSPFLSPSNLHPLFSPHMIMWVSSLPEFCSGTSLIWISSSQQRGAFPCDFVYNSEQNTCGVWKTMSNSYSITPLQATHFFSTGIFSIKLFFWILWANYYSGCCADWVKMLLCHWRKKSIYLRNFRYWVLSAKTWKM